jgi:hypothetical protein
MYQIEPSRYSRNRTTDIALDRQCTNRELCASGPGRLSVCLEELEKAKRAMRVAVFWAPLKYEEDIQRHFGCYTKEQSCVSHVVLPRIVSPLFSAQERVPVKATGMAGTRPGVFRKMLTFLFRTHNQTSQPIGKHVARDLEWRIGAKLQNVFHESAHTELFPFCACRYIVT